MLYAPLGQVSNQTLATLALNFDVTQGNLASSFPGYISAAQSTLAATINDIYVTGPGVCSATN